METDSLCDLYLKEKGNRQCRRLVCGSVDGLTCWEARQLFSDDSDDADVCYRCNLLAVMTKLERIKKEAVKEERRLKAQSHHQYHHHHHRGHSSPGVGGPPVLPDIIVSPSSVAAVAKFMSPSPPNIKRPSTSPGFVVKADAVQLPPADVVFPRFRPSSRSSANSAFSAPRASSSSKKKKRPVAKAPSLPPSVKEPVFLVLEEELTSIKPGDLAQPNSRASTTSPTLSLMSHKSVDTTNLFGSGGSDHVFSPISPVSGSPAQGKGKISAGLSAGSVDGGRSVVTIVNGRPSTATSLSVNTADNDGPAGWWRDRDRDPNRPPSRSRPPSRTRSPSRPRSPSPVRSKLVDLLRPDSPFSKGNLLDSSLKRYSDGTSQFYSLRKSP